MISTRYTRNFFLRALCVVYLFAFASIYVQIPGLYGDNGLVPARTALESGRYATLSAKVHYKPTLLWLAPFLGLDVQHMLELLALLGTFLAFTGFISQKFCTAPTLLGLWSLYFSIYQVGEVFLRSQWDSLLLEAGFVAVLLAPLLPGKKRGSKESPSDRICLWLASWLLFRFLISNGCLLLMTNTAKWWDLTALTSLFQSMPLPGPVSWYAYHMPAWVSKFACVIDIVGHTILPFLFFVPVRSVRLSAFTFQVLLQTLTVMTGNFDFLNILLVTLSISLLDDQVFYPPKKGTDGMLRWLGYTFNLLLHVGLAFVVIRFFGLAWNGKEITSKIMFSKRQFDEIIRYVLPCTVYTGFLALVKTIIKALSSAITDASHKSSKVVTVISTLLYTGIALSIFVASSVPLLSMHGSTNATVIPALRQVHKRLERLQLVNSYGDAELVKSADLADRFEVVLEGSDDVEGPWYEYNFLYRPSHVNHSLPFVAPYSPRLDQQMWRAAKGTTKEHPWLLALANGLLQGRPEVLGLLDRAHSPLGKRTQPPKYVRGQLYRYRYTKWSQHSQVTWWTRQAVGEQFPPYTKNNQALLDILRAAKMAPVADNQRQPVHHLWRTILEAIRRFVTAVEPTVLCWSIFSAGCVLIVTMTGSK